MVIILKIIFISVVGHKGVSNVLCYYENKSLLITFLYKIFSAIRILPL